VAKEKEEKVKPTSTPGFAFPTVIFEQVTNGCYVIFDRNESKFEAPSDPHHFYHEGEEYVPLKRLPWPAATRPKDYKSEIQLFSDVRAFYVEHLDIANDLFYDVYAAFTLATWRTEEFTVVPYAFFLGPMASGKTRALECFGRICYRGVIASSMSAASLFRALEAWHPVLLLDECEIYNREAMVEVLALLNSGYRKGQYAIRIEKVEEGCPQIAMFDTFGFKVLAGTQELASTLQSRCVITTMTRNVKQINLFIDEEKAQDLRNRLLMYRFKNLAKEPGLFEMSWLNGQFKNARVIELFVSLLQVAPTEDIRARLITCMKQITKSRLDEEQASIEARMFDAVLKCEKDIKEGKLSTQAITDTFNVGLSEKEQLKTTQVGRKVAALGFEKCRFGGGKSGFFWDIKLIERLKARYEPPSETPSLPSQPSLPSRTKEKLASEEGLKSEGSEQSEGSEGNLEALASQTLKLERLTMNYQDKCVACGFRGRMEWQATCRNGSWGLLCEECGIELEKRLNDA